MRPVLVVFAIAVTVLLTTKSSQAGVGVLIDKTHQRMIVSIDGQPRYSWPVSTGRRGYGTPNGVYRPERVARKWYSRKYYNSPMPHSIFFHGGFAIHGSYEISRLGGPASHGCVRLHPANAAVLYSLVREHGLGDTKIVVSGEAPAAIARPEPGYEPRRKIAPVFSPSPVFDRARYRWENMT
jgi:lipoprotein-anchoring transpeptidase ErfK/SrfK